ncbi:hypothetical protein P4O66_023090 [Electrophorus voltai]|uniref:Neugrin n=1 Tax=Electrophorus voltai TaxID=2609070 RepID=A0AAD8ZNM5_9TELE|nr:hypothetical protein P4O66_023090 [Electrophorus voltai]
MFSTLRVASMVALKVAFPVPTTAQICRHANQDVRVWMGSTRSDSDNRKKDHEDDLDMDAVEAKLESLFKEEKKRWKATKFHKIRRQLRTRGAPERRLTWDAVEQIRYLKQECTQEWTVQKLADSYCVSPDVISRILRSKFTPTLERKLKQDCKAMARQQSLGHGEMEGSNKGQSRLPVLGSTKPARQLFGNAHALTCQSRGALAKMEFETGLAVTDDNVTLLLRGTSQISDGLPVAQRKSQERLIEQEGPVDFEEENWDGVFFTEEQLEDLIYTLRAKPSTVKQKGREFFDSEGNFLYRI